MKPSVWREKIAKNDPHYPPRFHVYVWGNGLASGSITDRKAPISLIEAESMLRVLIESPETEWTYGYIEAITPVVRMGTNRSRTTSERFGKAQRS